MEQSAVRKNPIWIQVGDEDEPDSMFSGHQLHWSNCFFSNSYESLIRYVLENDQLMPGHKFTWSIREMTDEEVAAMPEVLVERERLLAEYGEC